MKKNLKNIFPVSGNFPKKIASTTLLGFERTINPQNLIKIVVAIFEKIFFFIFFLCELPLILGLGGRRKKNSWRYLREDPRYRFWTRSVNWFRLYVRRRSDRHTHARTHARTHSRTHTLTHARTHAHAHAHTLFF